VFCGFAADWGASPRVEEPAEDNLGRQSPGKHPQGRAAAEPAAEASGELVALKESVRRCFFIFSLFQFFLTSKIPIISSFSSAGEGSKKIKSSL